jgi:prevent-host-death family protein
MPPREVGLFETKTRLSELVRQVEAGERFFITRRGRRVAELRPIEAPRVPLRRGQAVNDGYRMADDFDTPLDDLAGYM